MVNNGHVQFKIESGGGFDSEGNPVAPVITLSDIIECNLSATNKANRQYKFTVDGEDTLSTYIIYVNIKLLPVELDMNDIQHLIIFDNRQNVLGEFRVQSKNLLEMMHLIKLIV